MLYHRHVDLIDNTLSYITLTMSQPVFVYEMLNSKHMINKLQCFYVTLFYFRGVGMEEHLVKIKPKLLLDTHGHTDLE